jgi:hypothetical protein
MAQGLFAGGAISMAKALALYQINTRIFLFELGQRAGRSATLADMPDETLDRIAELGFDWVWFLGVWQTGEAGQIVSRTQPAWREEYGKVLPDFQDDDVCGSPFAIVGYTAHADFGGPASLARLRERLHARGLRLLLDFVPNHTALDHAWVSRRPEFYIQGDEAALAREPQNYWRRSGGSRSPVFAHGRDPYFPGWPDTLQLNYRHAGLRAAMIGELAEVASQCDGVRCDMAMLLLPEIFQRTWGDRSLPVDGTPPVDTPFWPEAIAQVRRTFPDFLFLAEAYWDLEAQLLGQGFDYAYDKRLYDRLVARDAGAVRAHLGAADDFQRKLLRFLENHDEPRAAATFPDGVHEAAATLAFLTPAWRLVHEGEMEGRRVKASIHLRRRPEELPNRMLEEFYPRLLRVIQRQEVRQGRWRLLECAPAWAGNPTNAAFLAYLWEGSEGHLLVTVNFGATQGQCYVRLPIADLWDRRFVLSDLMHPIRYERDGADLAARGLYLDLPAWGYHLFSVTPL